MIELDKRELSGRKFTEERGYEDATLKPCPFCGFRQAKRYSVREHVIRGDKSFERTWWRCGCPACGVNTARAATPEIANHDWNSRAQ